jgi:SAM-dependent MidA family methyltransferase
MPQSSLPLPGADGLQHSQKLIDHIKAAIDQAGGQISFHDYMQMVLYAPGLGYYSAGSIKLGEAGDFITAPELSPLFSRCLARQCAQVLAVSADYNLLEFGAGSGRMAADILLTLERLQQLPNHYYILELSGELRQRQQQTLEQMAPHLLQRVSWLQQLPDQFSGVILANEVFDAMPVHLLHKQGKQIFECYVTYDEDGFRFQQVVVVDEELHSRVQPWLEQWPEQYTTEINLDGEAWINSLADIMQQGVILAIDYGFPAREYFHPQRSQGTLMCHYRHYSHDDVFFYPGLQDITAHVNFTALAEAALASGLTVEGYTTQAYFLMANALEQEMQLIQEQQELLKASQAVKRLTLPHEMGELFKVIAFGKDYEGSLQGFAWQDMRGRL